MNIKWPEGFKKTKQRIDVYQVLSEARKPMTAVEIFQKMPEYALSTIYRTLTAFEEQQMVTKSTLPGEDHAVFELTREGHTHYAMCLGCKEMVPLKHCPFEGHGLDVSAEEFEVTGHRIEIYGYCKSCKARGVTK